MADPIQPKSSLKKTFLKAQIVSLIATSVDFVTSLIFHHLLTVYYVTATSLGGFCGAITSFILGRNWAFQKQDGEIKYQIIKSLIVNAFSILLNSSGVYLVKEFFGLSFAVSRLITSLFVGVFFNFFMNKYYVFR